MNNYKILCDECLKNIEPLLVNQYDKDEYNNLVKLCGTGDAVTMADIKYRCDKLFKKLQDHNDPIDIDTIVQYELSHEEEEQRKAAEEQQRQSKVEAEAEQQRKEEEKQAEEQRRKASEEQQRQEAAESARLATEAEQQRKEEEKQAEEAARIAEEQQRQVEKKKLLNELKEEYNNMQLGDLKTNSINSVFNAVSRLPNMSDNEYAIVKTILDYIKNSTNWDVESSNSLDKIVQKIENGANDLKYYKSILSDISNIKSSMVTQKAKFFELVNAFNTNVSIFNVLIGNKRENMIPGTYGGMSFGGDDDYSDGRMALGGVMGGAILFSENAVAILMVTCIVLLMYLIHILYYQPCSGYKNRGHIYCGSLQNNEAIQYIAY